MLEIKNRIEDEESMASVLHSAVTSSNFQTAAGVAKDLLVMYPGQPDLLEVLERSLFNAALAEMRTYNLTGAENFLTELDELQPNDEVVDRILEFIAKYKARPVDMTLKVFIGSLEERQRRKLFFDEEGRVVTPSPTPLPESEGAEEGVPEEAAEEAVA
jgi:hypothetical protein